VVAISSTIYISLYYIVYNRTSDAIVISDIIAIIRRDCNLGWDLYLSDIVYTITIITIVISDTIAQFPVDLHISLLYTITSDAISTSDTIAISSTIYISLYYIVDITTTITIVIICCDCNLGWDLHISLLYSRYNNYYYDRNHLLRL